MEENGHSNWHNLLQRKCGEKKKIKILRFRFFIAWDQSYIEMWSTDWTQLLGWADMSSSRPRNKNTADHNLQNLTCFLHLNFLGYQTECKPNQN